MRSNPARPTAAVTDVLSRRGQPSLPAAFGRRLVAVFLVVAAATETASCTRPEASPALRRRVRLTTGIPGAGFFPIGATLAREFARTLPDLDFEVQESAGSVRNVLALQAGTADVGLAFADVAYVAFVGRLEEHPVRADQLRGIAVLNVTPVQLVARPNAAIIDVSQLRGRRVGIGPPGSGTALTSELVLRAFGLSLADVRSEGLPFTEAASRLVRGTLDAAFLDAAYPAEAITTATRAGGRLIPVDGPPVDALRMDYPFLRPTVIPPGTYPGHPRSVRTIGNDILLICRASLDEELVYRLTKALFEALPALASEVAALRLMDFEKAASTPVPLHEGAARYHRERELLR